jgi:hypothetical protein
MEQQEGRVNEVALGGNLLNGVPAPPGGSSFVGDFEL